uniref:FBA_2 domain-containing protein n=1 Tax=Caenorhabditis tropicalis TaxID=1561998 RepID=A0A1I7U1T0_9PELO
MTFPFFRVPQIVQSIIVNLAEPYELICLTQCSKRAYKLVKTYRKTSENVKIVVDIENTVKVYFDRKMSCRLSLDSKYGNQELARREYPTTNLFGADFCLSLFLSNIWKLKWDDPTTDGVLTLLDWVTDLFQVDVRGLDISEDTVHRWKWVESRQERIKSLYLSGGRYSKNDISNMIHSNSDNLLFMYITPRIEYSGILPSRTSFVSGNGFSFTRNPLMTSDFVHLSISDSTITDADVNQFLKHWLAGGNSRLKTASLPVDSRDLDDITYGIEGIHGNFETEVYWTIFGRKLTFYFRRLYLRRADGVMATCYIIENSCRRNEFVLAVWPDAKNNSCPIDIF